MVKALFDTNILIDYLNGEDAAAKELRRYRNKAISLITWMEVMVGADEQEAGAIKSFLSEFELLPIGPEVAAAAVKARRLHGFKLPDAIIYASAELDERLLITRNTKDFPPGLAGIRMPYELVPVAKAAAKASSGKSRARKR